MNVLSLFDGISCGQVAFNKLGVKFNGVDNRYFASEICKDSILVTNSNYPNTVQLGDVTKLDEAELSKLPKIDMLIGGSPCQDLSIANKDGKGLEGEKSKLFYEYVRILDWLRKNNNPDVLFLLENVKPKQETLEQMNDIMGTLPVCINSNLVSAQNRVRYYWTNIQGVEQPEDKGILLKDIIFDMDYKLFEDPRIEATKSYTKNYVKWDISGKGYGSQQDRAYYLTGKMCTVPKQRALNKCNIQVSETIYKRLHPIEGERLQNLPDDYTKIVKSPNSRLGLCGDGWTVDIIVGILKNTTFFK